MRLRKRKNEEGKGRTVRRKVLDYGTFRLS